MKIAVVGSGVAGLSAAWLLGQQHEVVLYEKSTRLGGHSNTVRVHAYGHDIDVDTGFIVYNEANYPELTALFDHLKVATEASDMSFAMSLDEGAFEYGSGDLAIFGQPSNLLDKNFRTMLRDLVRFNRLGHALAKRLPPGELSLGEWLTQHRFGPFFIQRYLLPLAASIWSSSLDDIARFPLRQFVTFFHEHRLFNVWRQQRWRTVSNGSRRYVEKLSAPLHACTRIGHAVVQIERSTHSVKIHDSSGHVDRFDQVVLACHADEALAVLAEPVPLEREVLSAFRYAPNRTILHTDASLMPKRRRVWSSWNFVADTPQPDAPVAVTYWMNRLQNIAKSCPIFVSNNPGRAPAAKSVLAQFDYSHPLFDRSAFAAQAELSRLQGTHRTWFCGSYFGFGFHEAALTSGLGVAEALGVRRPWIGEENKIGISPVLPLPEALPGLQGVSPALKRADKA
ncbi:MAG: FAD-dependent oxidoreductase [Rhodospirillales bacterium]